MSTDATQPSPRGPWVTNAVYDWQYIQSLRVAAATLLNQQDADAAARELAQAVMDLTDDLNRKEYRVLKALSNRRREPDQ